jgi:hypothetical protein
MPSFRPAEFGDWTAHQAALMQSLMARGFTGFQSVIIAGMIFNWMGLKTAKEQSR